MQMGSTTLKIVKCCFCLYILEIRNNHPIQQIYIVQEGYNMDTVASLNWGDGFGDFVSDVKIASILKRNEIDGPGV